MMTQVRNKVATGQRGVVPGRKAGVKAGAKATSPARTISPKQALTRLGPVDGLLSAEFFKAMSDSTRMSLLACLVKCGRACSVGEIAECCSVDLSVVSRHLRLLERAGLVASEKKGRVVSYRVRYVEWCRTLRDLAAAIESCCPEEGAACCGSESGACCVKGASDER
jgi:ArsR family transcriptional regulator